LVDFNKKPPAIIKYYITLWVISRIEDMKTLFVDE
jgi:hypothetical protein